MSASTTRQQKKWAARVLPVMEALSLDGKVWQSDRSDEDSSMMTAMAALFEFTIL
jgi:hypothetical protein